MPQLGRLYTRKQRESAAWWERTRQAVSAAAASKQALPLVFAGAKASQARMLGKAAMMAGDLVHVLRKLVERKEIEGAEVSWGEATTLALEAMRDTLGRDRGARPFGNEAFEQVAAAIVALQELLEICTCVLREPGQASPSVLAHELEKREMIVDDALEYLKCRDDDTDVTVVDMGGVSAAALAIVDDVEALRPKGDDVIAVGMRAKAVLEVLKRDADFSLARQATLDALAAKLAQLHELLLSSYKRKGWLQARWVGAIGSPFSAADADVERACDELREQLGLRPAARATTYVLEVAMVRSIEKTCKRLGGTQRDAAMVLSKDVAATERVSAAANVDPDELRKELLKFGPADCAHCGASIAVRAANFCPNCGQRVTTGLARLVGASSPYSPELKAIFKSAWARADAVVSRALEQLSEGDATGAHATLDGHRSDANACVVAGAALCHLGRYEAALDRLGDAIELDAGNVDAWFGMAVVRTKRGDEDLAAFEQCVALAPGHSMARTAYGTALFERRDADGAERELRRAIKADPSNAIAHTSYAMVLQLKRNHSAAQRLYKRAIDLDPLNSDALCKYGIFLYDVRNDSDAAEVVFKSAIDAGVGNSNAHLCYGCLLEQARHDYRGATCQYKLAIDADPTNAMAAKCYQRAQQKTHKLKEEVRLEVTNSTSLNILCVFTAARVAWSSPPQTTTMKSLVSLAAFEVHARTTTTLTIEAASMPFCSVFAMDLKAATFGFVYVKPDDSNTLKITKSVLKMDDRRRSLPPVHDAHLRALGLLLEEDDDEESDDFHHPLEYSESCGASSFAGTDS
ncbi:hypothetical protein CTAYLR_008025 [Chrysophaeum taylorii]|uniref:Uncharacterized protein n=1 Tax=Chrysophaeum taylorii TaxID=2483200 RepID=A0AAD7XHE0_9STRA|nr:hypothetical protein CTAYLR_008025 [Chrysophaeum taylorii]